MHFAQLVSLLYITDMSKRRACYEPSMSGGKTTSKFDKINSHQSVPNYTRLRTKTMHVISS